MTDLRNPRANRSLILKLIALTGAMFGFGFLLVPLYDVFCDLLDLDSRPALTAAVVTEENVAEDRVVTVEFMASVNEYGPWEFHPNMPSIEVHPGKLYDTTFYARNLTSRDITGQAVPSIAPAEAAKYFHKTECFCFSAQQFAPEESRDMPLQFMVDRDLPDYIDRLTLSYTFFVNPQVALSEGKTGS